MSADPHRHQPARPVGAFAHDLGREAAGSSPGLAAEHHRVLDVSQVADHRDQYIHPRPADTGHFHQLEER